MDPIYIEGGEVLASLDDRTITGLVLPYGEKGRTNVGIFEVEAGVIRIPEDPAVVGLNLDHDRFEPRGHGTRVWETSAGIMAALTVARTPEGDAALADARDPNGKRRRLSGEFRTGIKNGKATGGTLSGVALVERGAFPSAMVLASDTPDTAPDTAPDTDTEGEVLNENHTNEVYTDEDGREYRRVYDSETVETDTGTETTTTITETTTDSDESADTQEDQPVTATAVPATQRKTAPQAKTRERGPDLREIFAAFAEVSSDRIHRNLTDDSPAVQVLAALSDLKTSGTGALPTGGDVLQPNWLGQLYQGIPYERQYVALGTVGTNITLGGKKGYTLHRGTKTTPVTTFNGAWEGDKTPIASGGGFTESQKSQLFKWAFGEDIAREFFDLPGGADLIQAFFALVLEDHLVWSDNIALSTWVETAGAPVAPRVYPGVDGHDYPQAMGMLIQGILAVKKPKADSRRDTPTFAIANEQAYEELIYTPKDLVPEFVTFEVNTDRAGRGDALVVVVGDTGIENTPSIIVGSGKAVEFDELAGGPLKIDALDLARGGVDKAVHGYFQRFIVRPEAVTHIGTADTAPAGG